MFNILFKFYSNDIFCLTFYSNDSEGADRIVTVERKLALIDPHKSSGPDEIPNWFLKEFSVWLAEPVCAIFNASIREGEVPIIWKQANVVPIPKVHPPTDITKALRPISLTPTLSKVLESFIGNWTLQKIREKLDNMAV